MRLAAWDPAGNRWEEEGTPSIQQGALDAYKQQREAAAHSALRAPGPSVLKIGLRWSDHVFTPARHSLELVATLPGMYHLGVPHVREELLFSLVYLNRVVAAQRWPLMMKPVHLLFLLEIYYQSPYHFNQGEEERHPHVGHQEVTADLGQEGQALGLW